jgi:hypothetical protein
MALQASSYTTKELSTKTWRDFERLFSQENGWDFCQCMHFQGPCSLPKSEWLPTRRRAFGNESTHGTCSMFKKAGFKVVAPFGSTRFSTHVVVRRTV